MCKSKRPRRAPHPNRIKMDRILAMTEGLSRGELLLIWNAIVRGHPAPTMPEQLKEADAVREREVLQEQK